MNCKNCYKNLSSESKYCDGCGGKVVHDRITFKSLLTDVFTNAFGWDNKYFVTIKKLVVSPQIPLQEYINGTRKKYVNPFAFFAIGAAIALLVFNQFSEDYLSIINDINRQQIEAIDEVLIEDALKSKSDNSDVITESSNQSLSPQEFKKKQLEMGRQIQEKILKYFNIFSFMLLPFYAFISFLVFWKPYNYGEHLIINAYIQGLTFLTTSIFFLLSLVLNPGLYFFGIMFTIGYYTYAYSKLYKLSFGKAILKILKFIMIMVLFTIITGVLGFVIGYALGSLL